MMKISDTSCLCFSYPDVLLFSLLGCVSVLMTNLFSIHYIY